MLRLAVLALVAACGLRGAAAAPAVDLGPKPEARGPTPDFRCPGVPAAGPARGFHRLRDRLVAALGRPDHHGIDLIAVAGEDQVIAGRLAYGLIDKAAEHEDVELFACGAHGWRAIGGARSDGDGWFALALRGAARLPVGLRDLYASVDGDRSGVRFLAYVAPRGTPIVVSDVDGTLTASEKAFPHALFLGGAVAAQPGAAAALARAPAQVVYVTARGGRFAEATRRWLAANGFPRGPLVLARGLLVRPGRDTVAFKTRALHALERAFTIEAGLGNRASDVTAYTAAGLPAAHIFIKLPEFTSELARALAAHLAVGFTSYAKLQI